MLLLFSISVYAQEKDGASVLRTDSLRQVRHAGGQGLIIMPGAKTLPRGVSALDVFDIWIFNYTYGITSSTQISLFAPAPLFTDFQNVITLGVKQNYYDSENFSGAFYACMVFGSGVYTLGPVLTFGDEDNNFNMGYLYLGTLKGDSEGIILLGGKVKISRKFFFIAEYMNSKRSIDDTDINFNGLATAGIRFFTGIMVVDIGMSFPLIKNDMFLIPVIPSLKATFYF